MTEQLVSLAGAGLVLAAYAGHQLGLLDRAHPLYHAMNFVGALVLTVIAWRAGQWGFVLLEGAWAALSLPPLLGLRGRGSAQRA
mgnify:CR=1 FL=1